MEYVAMIGLLFAPIVCLLCAAWFYVRWQNEHDEPGPGPAGPEDLLHLSDRRCRVPGGLRRAEAAVSHLGIKLHALCGAPRKQANSSVHEVLCIIPGCPEGAREWHILFFAMLLHSKK